MSQWSIPLDRLAKRAGIRLETVARKVTFDLARAVIYRSPVDTGRFKGNWNVSFGAPNYSVGDSNDKTPLGSWNGFNESKARGLLSLPIGGVTYISNGLPYGPALEFGRGDGRPGSRQAPQGMVRITAREFSTYVQRALR